MYYITPKKARSFWHIQAIPALFFVNFVCRKGKSGLLGAYSSVGQKPPFERRGTTEGGGRLTSQADGYAVHSVETVFDNLPSRSARPPLSKEGFGLVPYPRHCPLVEQQRFPPPCHPERSETQSKDLYRMENRHIRKYLKGEGQGGLGTVE